MNSSLYTQLQTLSTEQVEDALIQFSALATQPDFLKEVFVGLGSEFTTQEVIQSNYQTYWRWYIVSTWKMFPTFTIDEFVERLEQQLPYLFYLEIPIQEHILYFAYRILIDPPEQQKFFSALRTMFSDPARLLNPLVAKSVSLSSFLVEAETIEVRGTTLEKTKLMQQIGDILSTSPLHFDYVDVKSIDVAEQLVELLIFFSKERDLGQVSFNFYQQMGRTELDSADADLTADIPYTRIKELQRNIPSIKEVPEESNIPLAEERVTSYADVKILLLAQFGPIETLGIENITPVYTALAEQATKANDPTINSLIMYNEVTGTFEWNDEVFTV